MLWLVLGGERIAALLIDLMKRLIKTESAVSNIAGLHYF